MGRGTGLSTSRARSKHASGPENRILASLTYIVTLYSPYFPKNFPPKPPSQAFESVSTCSHLALFAPARCRHTHLYLFLTKVTTARKVLQPYSGQKKVESLGQSIRELSDMPKFTTRFWKTQFILSPWPQKVFSVTWATVQTATTELESEGPQGGKQNTYDVFIMKFTVFFPSFCTRFIAVSFCLHCRIPRKLIISVLLA